MEENGELAEPDAWGFMEAEPEVAAGSSSTAEQMSNEAIALGITDSALVELRASNRKARSETGYLPGYKTAMGGTAGVAAAVRAGRRAINDNDVSRSPSPEFDTGAGKNKGRRGQENDSYASHYSAHEDDDDMAAHSDGSGSSYSEDDENVILPAKAANPSGRTAAATSLSSHQPFRRPKFDNSDSDSGSSAPQSRVPQNWGSSAPNPNSSPPHGRRAGRGAVPLRASASSTADADILEISSQERQRLGIPANMALTRASLARFEQRKSDEGNLAMRQHASGGLDEE